MPDAQYVLLRYTPVNACYCGNYWQAIRGWYRCTRRCYLIGDLAGSRHLLWLSTGEEAKGPTNAGVAC
ncbi:hypothetical protein NDU88_002800 [Pleurodeles waltl]|uniref:Uncharacterized protein n=1 Tax=Pleurodeles waltl TaxID=8319 RepID=A0AAV7PBX5_PLEWA|nr:hypothetical protein NDU88_002800 [Pleurodeles waltl]